MTKLGLSETMACKDILHNNDEGIKEFLYRFRPKLSQCDLYGLTRDERKKTKFVRGRSIENMVHRWLEDAGAEFAKFPQTFGCVHYERYDHDIVVYQNNKIKYFFDELCWIRGEPYVVQIKSNMLWHASKQSLRTYDRRNYAKSNATFNHRQGRGMLTNIMIGEGLVWGNDFFGEQCDMLLFFPQNRELREIAAGLLEKFYPGVHCIDLGYKDKQLKKFVKNHTISELRF